jgi:hypothetical protein
MTELVVIPEQQVKYKYPLTLSFPRRQKLKLFHHYEKYNNYTVLLLLAWSETIYHYEKYNNCTVRKMLAFCHCELTKSARQSRDIDTRLAGMTK